METRLSEQEIQAKLSSLEGWALVGGELVKTFSFKNYYEAMAFVNATAWISHGEDHHPDVELGYNKVKMRYSTHSAGGVTEKDFACARQVDGLMKKRGGG